MLIPKLKECGKSSTQATDKFKKISNLFTIQAIKVEIPEMELIINNKIPPLIIKVANGITNKFDNKK